MSNLKITSSAFENNNVIPDKYTCKGQNINPPLHIDEIPKNAKSLALIVDDPDAPNGDWVHWIVFNIFPNSDIKENSLPGKLGISDFKKNHYVGPCPPSGTHRYFFKVYALDANLTGLTLSSTKHDLVKAMEGHVVAKGELVGLASKD